MEHVKVLYVERYGNLRATWDFWHFLHRRRSLYLHNQGWFVSNRGTHCFTQTKIMGKQNVPDLVGRGVFILHVQDVSYLGRQEEP